MWTVSEAMCLGMLAGVSVGDVLFRKIPVDILIIGSGVGVIYQLISRKMSIWLIAGGVGVGCIFLFLSKVTKEGIGYGDSWGILSLGIYLGFWNLLSVLSGAFFLLFVVAIPVLWIKRMSRKFTFPFYPFLACSYLLFLINGGSML